MASQVRDLASNTTPEKKLKAKKTIKKYFRDFLSFIFFFFLKKNFCMLFPTNNYNIAYYFNFIFWVKKLYNND